MEPVAVHVPTDALAVEVGRGAAVAVDGARVGPKVGVGSAAVTSLVALGEAALKLGATDGAAPREQHIGVQVMAPSHYRYRGARLKCLRNNPTLLVIWLNSRL